MHIALIMDGNRRWAQERGLHTYEGHKQGVERVKELIEAGQNLGLKAMTFYCFSTENWKRSSMEIKYLMKLFTAYIRNSLNDMIKNEVQIRHVGRKDRLPKSLLNALTDAETKSARFKNFTVNLALDYGGRDEIMRAVERYSQENCGKKEQLTEEILAKYLDLYPHTNVDLLIRTSGEQRISNFLIWELAYSELFFEKCYFPDFTAEKLQKCLQNFKDRQRRFGQ